MALPSTTFTEMVSTTLRNFGRELADNVADHNALLYYLREKGKIETMSGGYEIQKPLMYAENGTIQRYSGYDTLSTAASDVLTSAKYEWRQIALHVTASGKEVRENNSKERMIDLVKARREVAMKTGSNFLSRDMYSDGTASNQINGLQALVSTDGTGTVGGIDASAQAWWANQFKEMTGTNLAASPSAANAVSMKGDMNALWLKLNRGMDKPQLVVMSHDFYALFELGEQQLQRYRDAGLAKAGFDALKYKSADVIFDDNTNFSTTQERGYFLNCDYLNLVQHADAQWTVDDTKRPTNQDAIVIPIYWMGNMCTSNRDLQGILIDEA
jgi:hypothetical protein